MGISQTLNKVGESLLVIHPHQFVNVTGTWTPATDANVTLPWYTHYLGLDTHNINDKCRVKILLQAGTYTLKLWYWKGTTAGIIDVTLGGTVVVNDLDFYNAGGLTYNNISTTTGIVIPAGDLINLDIEVVSKNGGSGDYGCQIQGIILYRTA